MTPPRFFFLFEKEEENIHFDTVDLLFCNEYEEVCHTMPEGVNYMLLTSGWAVPYLLISYWCKLEQIDDSETLLRSFGTLLLYGQSLHFQVLFCLVFGRNDRTFLVMAFDIDNAYHFEKQVAGVVA